MTTATLYLPQLREDQYQIATDPAKVKVLSMGRRWGKTVMSGVVAVTAASMGAQVAWVVPVYKNGRPLWRWAESTVAPLKKHGVKVNRTERLIEFPNGGSLGVYSADNEDSMRGEAFHLVIVDEAAKVPETAYTDVIQPTLADYDGDLILISTPRGRNWFFNEYTAALADGQTLKAWKAPTSANPNPNIQQAFILAQTRVPERTYRQEWLAEFVTDSGEVFRRITEVCTASKQSPYEGHFVFGVDWAQSQDYTVIVVMDSDTRTVVDYDRFNGVSWALQRGRLTALYEAWKPEHIYAESNSIGGPNIEALVDEGLPMRRFETTAVSKPPLIESLVLAFERGEITALNDPQMIGELMAYERKVSSTTGRSQYSAPEGLHDDIVMALALAWRGVLRRVPDEW